MQTGLPILRLHFRGIIHHSFIQYVIETLSLMFCTILGSSQIDNIYDKCLYVFGVTTILT